MALAISKKIYIQFLNTRVCSTKPVVWFVLNNHEYSVHRTTVRDAYSCCSSSHYILHLHREYPAQTSTVWPI